MRRIAILSGISLVILFSISNWNDAEAILYSNDKFGISITLPQDWQIFDVREMLVLEKTVHGGDIHVIFSSPDEKMGLMLVNHDGPLQLDEYFEHFQYYHTYDNKVLEHYKSKFQKIYGKEVVNINGYHAIKTKAIDESGADVFVYTFASDKTGFQLTTMGSGDFQNILDSINIKNGLKFETKNVLKEKWEFLSSDKSYDGFVKSVMVLSIRPLDVKYNENNDLFYVSPDNTDNVVVIDKKLGSISKLIPVENPGKIAINSKTNEIYVASRGSSVVNIINGKDSSLSKIDFGNLRPYGLVIDEDTNTVYVSNKVNNTVTVLDGSSKKLISHITVENLPTELVVNPKYDSLYIINSNSSSISVVDTSSNTLKKIIKLAKNPIDIAVDHSRNLVYIINDNSKVVTKMDRLSNEIAGNIELEKPAHAVMLNQNNDRMIFLIQSKFLIMNPETEEMIEELRIENADVGAVDDSLDFALYGKAGESGLYLLDLERQKSSKIDLGYSPTKLSVNTNTNKLYVANSNPNSVIVVDVLNKRVDNEIELRFKPTDLRVNPSTNKIYVIHRDEHRVSVIDGDKNTVIKEISVGKPQMTLYQYNREEFLEDQLFSSHPEVIEVDSSKNKIYVGDSNYTWEVDKGRKEILRHLESLIYVIDGHYDEVVDKIRINNFINGLSVDEFSNKIFVSSYFYEEPLITLVSSETNRVAQELELGDLFEIEFNPKLNILHGVERKEHYVSFYVVDVESKKITSERVFRGWWLTPIFTLDMQRNVVYFAAGGLLYVLDGKTAEIIDKIEIGSVSGMAFDPYLGTLYVSSASGTLTILEQGQKKRTVEVATQLIEEPKEMKIPNWIRNNAGWWAEGSITDSDFVKGIQFMVKERIIMIPETAKSAGDGSGEIPSWIKNNAGWWAEGLISDDDFVKGIQYLVEHGIIRTSG